MQFTQRQVARIIGHLSSMDVSHYEHSRKLPSLATALEFEIVYRVPVAFLYPELYRQLKDRLQAREERLRASEGRGGPGISP